MFNAKEVKITNSERLAKRERKNWKFNHMTPQKYLDKQSTWRTYYKLEKKFGYDYDINDSKSLKYMKEDFQNKAFSYLGKREWTKNLGTKDKYERNMQLGRPLKRNPVLKIFGKIESIFTRQDKMLAMKALRNLKK